MKIIVLGAGQVGATVAENLARENNDVTVVDINNDVLAELQSRMDLRTVHGHASFPDVLRKAGAEDADMIIAATNSDETNIVAMQIAYTLFHTPSKIARIRSQEYIPHPKADLNWFDNDHIPINVAISPELLVRDRLARIIEHPGALQVVDFANGIVRLVGIRVDEGAAMDGKPISELRVLLADRIETRVVAIFRGDDSVEPKGDTLIQSKDIVFFLGERVHTQTVMALFHQEDSPSRFIVIAGGGNIGFSLARSLESRYRVKLIERNPDRASYLAEKLESAMVLVGDAANHELMVEENVADADVFCALTNDDEANILSAMLAKSIGASKVMSLINRNEYVNLVENDIDAIDVAISPQSITIGALLTHIRRGDVVAVYSLRKGSAEALEGIAHGDPGSSPVVGRTIEQLQLPKGATIGAVVRGTQVKIAHHDLEIIAEDHIIVLTVNRAQITEVEKLFQVNATYI